jgi:hypothetical protein
MQSMQSIKSDQQQLQDGSAHDLDLDTAQSSSLHINQPSSTSTAVVSACSPSMTYIKPTLSFNLKSKKTNKSKQTKANNQSHQHHDQHQLHRQGQGQGQQGPQEEGVTRSHSRSRSRSRSLARMDGVASEVDDDGDYYCDDDDDENGKGNGNHRPTYNNKNNNNDNNDKDNAAAAAADDDDDNDGVSYFFRTGGKDRFLSIQKSKSAYFSSYPYMPPQPHALAKTSNSTQSKTKT